jgi:hypothetical protein
MMKRRMNRKGWVRIVEAFFAVLIILGAVLVIMEKQIQQVDISDVVYEKERSILNVIVNNDSLREDILGGDMTNVNDTITQNFPNTWAFTTNVCNLDEACNENTPDDRDVYVSETLITASLTQFPEGRSKRLKLFVWRK